MQTRGGWSLFEYAPGSREEGGLVSKLVWRVKLVTELEPGVTTETEVACLERGEEAGLAALGLRLNEPKQLTAALRAEMVSAQVAAVGERCRSCAACGRVLASKGYYRATVRSLFGRRAGPGPTGARRPLPRPGRAEELRRPRPRRGYGRTGASAVSSDM